MRFAKQLRAQAAAPGQPRASLAGKRNVVRLGFLLLVTLLIVSTLESYRILRSQSSKAIEIYRQHLDQDVVLYRLRRTLWLASVMARDFLMNPQVDRELQYKRQFAEVSSEAAVLQSEYERLAAGHESTKLLKQRLAEYWKVLEQMPDLTANFSAAQRYEFVQREIVPRRNAAGDVLRGFSEVQQQALRDSDAAFEVSRKDAAERLFALLGISMFLGLLVAYTSLSHSEALEGIAEQQHKAVERARHELQLLAGKLMSLQEDERTRLSRELHDEIGQSLATMRLEVVRTEAVCRERFPEVLDRLGRARDLTEGAIRVVRNMSTGLRPSVLDDLGLEPALRSLVQEFSLRSEIKCSLLVPALPPLSEGASTCVYRVVQESLHNCEKHARASRVAVTLETRDGSLLVEVTDNGVGFDTSASAKGIHLGILGMKERASAAGGSLDVTSSPGSGTRICLTIPVDGSLVSDETAVRGEVPSA